MIQRFPDYTCSLVIRSALWTALVAIVATATLFVMVHLSVANSLRAGVVAGVNADLAGLADIYATNGPSELKARIADRSLPITRDGRQPHYLLRIDGRKVAGDLDVRPPLQATSSATGEVSLGGGRTGFARATLLAPGVELIVAREDGPEQAALQRLAIVFAVGAAAILLIVLALATWRARILQQRIERVNQAYRHADSVEVDRLTGDRSSDEIGELTRQSGRALAKLMTLVETQRLVTDQIAHEIRTPLLHLETRLSRLPANPAPTDVEEVIRLAASDVREITTLLDSLLDIASTDAARGDQADLKLFDLSRLVADLAEVYRGSMEDAGLDFLVSVYPDRTLVGERTQIGRLVANLLDNAIKYVPSGGQVLLSVSADGSVTVTDNGPGIPTEQANYVFERFRRAPSSAGVEGHGLGLALARSIALRHDMTLELKPSSTGCQFVLSPSEGSE